MARGINKVILIGNLGRDPEVKYLPSGAAVAEFGLATSEQWKDKETGEKKERTEWHNIKIFGKLAEIAGEYLKKGSTVYLEGALRTRDWEKDGQKHYRTEVIVNQMQMLGGRGGGTASYDDEPAPSRGSSGRSQSRAPADTAGEPLDDDIPF